MIKKLSRFALPILATTTLLTSSCVSRDFSKDPVKWWFVGGDGSWDSGLRKWAVYLVRGETKSATFCTRSSVSIEPVVDITNNCPKYEEPWDVEKRTDQEDVRGIIGATGPDLD